VKRALSQAGAQIPTTGERNRNRFKVQEAYEVLRDPEKRAAYDPVGWDYRTGQQFRRRRTGRNASVTRQPAFSRAQRLQ
jgi:DnaJ-class molecular chaperone